jgi:hypothetical protein
MRGQSLATNDTVTLWGVTLDLNLAPFCSDVTAGGRQCHSGQVVRRNLYNVGCEEFSVGVSCHPGESIAISCAPPACYLSPLAVCHVDVLSSLCEEFDAANTNFIISTFLSVMKNTDLLITLTVQSYCYVITLPDSSSELHRL